MEELEKQINKALDEGERVEIADIMDIIQAHTTRAFNFGRCLVHILEDMTPRIYLKVGPEFGVIFSRDNEGDVFKGVIKEVLLENLSRKIPVNKKDLVIDNLKELNDFSASGKISRGALMRISLVYTVWLSVVISRIVAEGLAKEVIITGQEECNYYYYPEDMSDKDILCLP